MRLNLPTVAAIFSAIQASINSLNNSPSTQRELIIITDGEASAWKQFESISRALNENKENIKTTIALVGNAPNENIAITSLSQNSNSFSRTTDETFGRCN